MVIRKMLNTNGLSTCAVASTGEANRDTQDMREILREVVKGMDDHEQFIDHYFSDTEY